MSTTIPMTSDAEPREKGECDAAFGPPGTVQAWCTLPAGHSGDHEAYGTDESRGPVKTWPRQ